MKRLAVLLLGLALVTSTSGCCWWWPWSGGYYGGGCQYGNCGIAPTPGYGGQGTYIPQSSYYGSYSTIQAGVPVATPYVAAQPIPYPATAMGPLEPLPTY